MPHHAIAARISVDPTSAQQVRPVQDIEAVPLRLRAVKASTVELVGELYLPRQCAVRISFHDASEPWAGPGQPGPLRDMPGEVRRVQMLDGTPAYAISVQLEGTPPQVLDDLRDRLEA